METYSGTSNLTAGWEANTINLHWYNGNTELTVPSESQSCVYDGALNPPATIPTRTGYTFVGWRVRPTYNFSTLPTNQNGEKKWARTNMDTCGYKEGNGNISRVSCSNSDFDDLGAMEWKVQFPWGMVYGMTMCSVTSAAHATTGNPSNTSGGYCWCKMTGYKSNDTLYAPSVATPWVCDSPSVLHDCNTNTFNCVAGCAYYVLWDVTFRQRIFGKN